MRKYISCVETAKLVRKALKEHFPGIKFSVKKSAGGSSIYVKWLDGPAEPAVEKVVRFFEGATFDGSVDLKAKKESEKMATITALSATLENYLKSDDFKSGVIASTRASWGGSGYSVELFPDGTWRNLWNKSIGNKYESEGVILRLPTFTDDGTYQEAVNGVGLPEGQEPMSEEDYFDLCFVNEEDELAKDLREALSE